MAKSINLTPRDTPKKKKHDKYSEISDIKNKPPKPKFSVLDKVVYVGLIDEYRGLEGTITKINRKIITHYYTLKFDNDEEIDSIVDVYLKIPEEYELSLLNQDKDNGEISDNDSQDS